MKATPLKPILLLCLLALPLIAGAQKQQRLKQIWYREFVSYPNQESDSTIFYYSGNRGSHFSLYLYDGRYYGYDHLIYLNYYPVYVANTRSSTDHTWEQSILYDSAYHYKRLFATDPPRLQKYYANYTKDTLITNWQEPGAVPNIIYATNWVYNAEGRPTLAYMLKTDTVTKVTDTISHRSFLYTENNKILADSLFKTDMREYFYYNYTYNNEGDLKTILQTYEQPQQNYLTRHNFTYSTDKRTVKVERESLYGNVWEKNDFDILQYDGENRLIKYTTYIDENKPPLTREMLYDANGDLSILDITDYSANNVVTCDRQEFYFNKYHNPDSVITWYGYCVYGFTSKDIAIYTYETYGEDTVAIKRPPFIYPNPASDMVHIRWNSYLRKTPVQLHLYTAMGQLAHSYTIASPAPEDEFSVAGLSAGVYVLRIYTDNNEPLYTGKLVVR